MRSFKKDPSPPQIVFPTCVPDLCLQDLFLPLSVSLSVCPCSFSQTERWQTRTWLSSLRIKSKMCCPGCSPRSFSGQTGTSPRLRCSSSSSVSERSGLDFQAHSKKWPSRRSAQSEHSGTVEWASTRGSCPRLASDGELRRRRPRVKHTAVMSRNRVQLQNFHAWHFWFSDTDWRRQSLIYECGHWRKRFSDLEMSPRYWRSSIYKPFLTAF